ncbi:MAG TPA: hypothetical protein VGK89_10910 [Candidatus Eisenbacteria bacterium]
MKPTRAPVPLALACALVAAVPAGAAGAEPSTPIETEEVLLRTNRFYIYPHEADICLSTYRPMTDEPGVILSLRSDVEGFSHYRYSFRRDSLPPGRPLESRSGEIQVRFDGHNPRPQHVVTTLRAVSRSGRESKPFSIELGFYPKEYYAAAGQRSRGWLVVHTSDILLCGSSVTDWIVERPSEEDRAYARKRWSAVVKPFRTNYEKAQAVARALVAALRPHEGIPSDKMRHVPAFEQLERAESGRDRVWCGNYADIFSTACNALSIPVRKIDMQYVWPAESKVDFEIAEAHRTTEVFDRELNRWVWMDLTFGVWGARMGENHEPLNTVELVNALNDDLRRERLRIVEYDHVSGGEKVVRLMESERRKSLLKYFRRDQRYKFVRTARAAAR